jgi:hypothetical protein
MAGLGALTVSVSEAVFPVPPFVDETAPDVLANVPTLETVTVVVMVHEPPAATVPPLRLMEFPPAARVRVPPHELDVLNGFVFVTPAGYVSVNATPVSALFRFGFEIVKVNVDVPFARIGLGANNLEMAGGFNTVRVAEALPVEPVFVPPFVDDINPLTF